MTAEEQIEQLTAQLQQALDELKQTHTQLQATQEKLRQAQARIAEMEKQKMPPPSFVKANAKKPRKKREAQDNRARKRSVSTQIEEHHLAACPDCGLRLEGISLARVREVIDAPAPPPVEVIEHRIYKGWCSGCQRWHEAPVDFAGQVLGQGCIGVRLTSIIAYLRTVMRQIQAVLRDLHGFQVSLGELVELPHRIKTHYLTRNRTHGSDFPPFSSLVEEVPTIVSRCFCICFRPRERIDLH